MALFGTNYLGQSSPVSPGNVSAVGGAVGDIFGGFADLSKMSGLEAEASEYNLAAAYAGQEAQYSKMSTAINTAQANREMYLSLGRTSGEVAGAGIAASGSALDILRSSASQGALQSAAVQQQGLIQTAGYEEQEASYTTMANAANAAAKSESLAATGSFVGAGISALAAFA